MSVSRPTTSARAPLGRAVRAGRRRRPRRVARTTGRARPRHPRHARRRAAHGRGVPALALRDAPRRGDGDHAALPRAAGARRCDLARGRRHGGDRAPVARARAARQAHRGPPPPRAPRRHGRAGAGARSLLLPVGARDGGDGGRAGLRDGGAGAPARAGARGDAGRALAGRARRALPGATCSPVSCSRWSPALVVRAAGLA
jgi:hypothetical protein